MLTYTRQSLFIAKYVNEFRGFSDGIAPKISYNAHVYIGGKSLLSYNMATNTLQ